MNRRTFLALCGAAERSCAGRLGTSWLKSAHVQEHMPKDGEAEFLGCVTGGDESLAVSRWRIPLVDGSVEALLLVPHVRLAELERA